MNKCDCGLLTKESVAIPLRGVEVKGVITGRAAKVKVRQHFTNLDASAVEAVYKFPLPESSAVCGFRAAIGDSTWEGRVEERDKAFKEYDEALARGDGGYLLDEERPNIFTLSLGNLNPKASAIVEIDYVTTLDTHGQSVRFCLPTTISPRYVPDGMDRADIPVEDIVNPVYAESVPYGLRIDLDIHRAEGIAAISSPSHRIRVSEAMAKVEFAAETVAMDRDLVLDVEYKDRFRNRAFLYTEGDAQYIQLDMTPVLKAPVRKGNHDAEVIFVLDCSGSMSGSSIDEAKQALAIFLKGMDESMLFNVYRFGSRFENLFEASRPYSTDNLNRATEYLSGVDADLGGTELLAPLRHILGAGPGKSRARKVVLITDGEIGNEQEVSRLVRENAETTSLFAVGIGYGPNEYLIKQLARSSGGAAECITPGERIEPVVLRLFQKVLSGRLGNPTVTWAAQVDQAPSSLIIYDGQALSIFGRTGIDAAAMKQIAVTGDYLGKRQEWKIDVMRVTGPDIPVSLLWAREKIRDLEEGTAGEPGSKQVSRKETAANKAIIDLSKKHGVLSRETSFIAVEERPDLQRTTGDTVLRKIPAMLTKDWHGGVFHAASGMPSTAPLAFVPRLSRVSDHRILHAIPALSCDEEDGSARYSPASRLRGYPVFAMLALQRAEGGFELDEAVTQMLGLSYRELREHAARIQGKGRFDRWVLLSTVIVLRALETRFAGDSAVWYDVTQKTRKWYESEAQRVRPSIDGMALSDWADDYIDKKGRAPTR